MQNINKGEPIVVVSIDLAKGLENVAAQVKVDISANNITVSVNPSDSSYSVSRATEDFSDVDPETIAVITAAAYEYLGKPFRVKSVRMFADKDDTPWTRMGRFNSLVGSQNFSHR